MIIKAIMVFKVVQLIWIGRLPGSKREYDHLCLFVRKEQILIDHRLG